MLSRGDKGEELKVALLKLVTNFKNLLTEKVVNGGNFRLLQWKFYTQTYKKIVG